MQCILVTPEATLRDVEASFVVVTLFDGELGIAPGHAPLIGRLGCGEVRIEDGGGLERFYVEGGFVEVLDNVVSVLTPRAIPAAAIDTAVAREQLADAMAKPAHTLEQRDARDRAVAQSRAQLRVARHAK